MTDLQRERGRAARHPIHPIFGHPLLNSKEPYYEGFILWSYGYNVIFWLPKVFDREDLESSRKKLIDLLEDYGAHNNLEMIVVFDGRGQLE